LAWAERGRRAEAHRLVAPVYEWFTEGFDTPDLIEADALLGELAFIRFEGESRPSKRSFKL
jgi:predicted ATPase